MPNDWEIIVEGIDAETGEYSLQEDAIAALDRIRRRMLKDERELKDLRHDRQMLLMRNAALQDKLLGIVNNMEGEQDEDSNTSL